MSETTPKDGAPEAAVDTEQATGPAEAASGTGSTGTGATEAQAAEAAAGAAKKRKHRGEPTGKLLRIAIGLVFVGLALELVPLLYFRPITFVIFFFLGIPIAGLGMLLYLWRVLRNLRETGAL